MKKLIIAVFLGLAFTNVGFADYGEDQKGACVKGKDSTRGQEVVAEAPVQKPAEKPSSSSTTGQ